MPPRSATILPRLRQDLPAGLGPRAITDACKAVGHRWRDGVLNPVTTAYLFLLQVLHGNTACQHVVHFRGLDLLRQRLLPGPQAAAPERLAVPPGEHRG